MRIIAGALRGHRLRSPDNDDIRPTTDRVRESLFSILESRYPNSLDDSRILDLFAGTGTLGLEAISRGANFCLFVENSAKSAALVKENINSLKLENQTEILRTDAVRMGAIDSRKPFDLVFVDPPYNKGIAAIAVPNLVEGGWLHSDALLVIEDKAGNSAPMLPGISILDERKFGATKLWFAKPQP